MQLSGALIWLLFKARACSQSYRSGADWECLQSLVFSIWTCSKYMDPSQLSKVGSWSRSSWVLSYYTLGGVIFTSTRKNHVPIGSVHPVMDKHLQGALCLLQFQPHLRRNWWEFWVFHLLCGTKKPLRWYRIFQKLDLGTSRNKQKSNRWTSTNHVQQHQIQKEMLGC